MEDIIGETWLWFDEHVDRAHEWLRVAGSYQHLALQYWADCTKQLILVSSTGCMQTLQAACT